MGTGVFTFHGGRDGGWFGRRSHIRPLSPNLSHRTSGEEEREVTEVETSEDKTWRVGETEGYLRMGE